MEMSGLTYVDLEESEFMGLANFESYAEAWRNLKRRGVRETVFIYDMDLYNMGLWDKLQKWLDRIHLRDMAETYARTYERCTLEFVASLKRHTNTHGQRCIRFHLNDVVYTVTLRQVCSIFGWDVEEDGEEYRAFEHTTHFKANRFWKEICEGSPPPPRRNYNMWKAPYQLAHRLLASTVCIHSDINEVTEFDLKLLWAMKKPGRGVPKIIDNWVDSVIGLQTTTHGAIHMGGMVTVLARRLNISIPDTLVPLGDGTSHFYSFKTLQRKGMIALYPERGYLHWLGLRPLVKLEHYDLSDFVIHPTGITNYPYIPWSDDPNYEEMRARALGTGRGGSLNRTSRDGMGGGEGSSGGHE